MRGTDASGFAFATRDGRTGMFKDAVTGSQLSLKELPRDADTVIAHTRFSTLGDPKYNWNNHPVEEPSGRIRLTHNGHISNHSEVREILPESTFNKLATVDTSVLPAMLAAQGVDGFAQIAGDAAAGWLDTETGNTLHLARMSHSPIAIARLTDGSVVYASTERILARALIRSNLTWVGQMYPDHFAEFEDGQYVQITDGIISQQEDVEWYEDYYTTSYGWRAVTSGVSQNHTTVSTTRRAWEENDDDPWAATWSEEIMDSGGWYDEFNVWHSLDETYREQDGPAVLDAYRYPNGNYAGPAKADKFYATDHEGDYEGYASLYALMSYMKWTAGISSENVLVAEGEERWVNHFMDVGQVMDDGSFVSWVTNPESTYEFETEEDISLSFIRTGAHVLRGVMA